MSLWGAWCWSKFSKCSVGENCGDRHRCVTDNYSQWVVNWSPQEHVRFEQFKDLELRLQFQLDSICVLHNSEYKSLLNIYCVLRDL